MQYAATFRVLTHVWTSYSSPGVGKERVIMIDRQAK